VSQTRDRLGPLARKHHALARRLLDRQDDYLRFTRHFAVPPDNNWCFAVLGWAGRWLRLGSGSANASYVVGQ
jgi:hypothetical protein